MSPRRLAPVPPKLAAMLTTRNLIRPCAAQTVGVPSAFRRGFLIALKKIKKHLSAKILDENGYYHKDFFSKETVEKSKMKQANTGR